MDGGIASDRGWSVARDTNSPHIWNVFDQDGVLRANSGTERDAWEWACWLALAIERKVHNDHGCRIVECSEQHAKGLAQRLAGQQASAEKPESPAESILLEAQRLVHGDRGEQYGTPLDDFGCSAEILSALVMRRYGVRIAFDADFIGLFMACGIKGSRAAANPKRDTLVDGAGYFETIRMCIEERDRRAKSAAG